jgi:hypothetical protein
MHFGLTALGSAQPAWVVASTNGVTPVTPTAAPSWTTYEEGTNTAVQTGTMTGEVDSKTGLYRVSITASSGNGYGKSKTYLIHMSYVSGGTTYVQTGTFTVV